MQLKSFEKPLKIVIIGSSGALGHSFVDLLSQYENVDEIIGFSRSENTIDNPKFKHHSIDVCDSDSIEQAANQLDSFNLLIVSSGILHENNLLPEKRVNDLDKAQLMHYFEVNTIGPALIGKYFMPKMDHHGKSVMAFLSAKVGSISDNGLGGWYGYRASKAALNMIVRNFAIEVNRMHPDPIIVSLHPGTVDSYLSKPFQKGVASDHLFEPDFAAGKLIEVIEELSPSDSGKFLDYAKKELPF